MSRFSSWLCKLRGHPYLHWFYGVDQSGPQERLGMFRVCRCGRRSDFRPIPRELYPYLPGSLQVSPSPVTSPASPPGTAATAPAVPPATPEGYTPRSGATFSATVDTKPVSVRHRGASW